MSNTQLNAITFGTSGFRGVRGDSFFPEHVQAIAHAVADYLIDNALAPHICVGADPRFGHSFTLEDGSFTAILCNTLVQRGISVDFFNKPTPTPLISWHIVDKQLSGGLILTASHNPAEYNGIKFNPANGAPAPTHITDYLETAANKHLNSKAANDSEQAGKLVLLNRDADYAEHLCSIIRSIFADSVSLQTLRVIADCKHGTSADIWQLVLDKLTCSDYKLLHTQARADFAALETNPTSVKTFEQAKTDIKAFQADVYIANDPDADRHMIFDETGQPLSPELCSLIIAQFLLATNQPLHSICSTVASSRQLSEFCQQHALKYHETAVGFKYFSPYLTEAKRDKHLSLAVESSGGFSISSHTMEKCGFLPGLLIASISAQCKQPISQLKSALLSSLRPAVFTEAAATFDASKKASIQAQLNNSSIEQLAPFFELTIRQLNASDGLKIIFDTSDWVLIRFSGTEPLARLYCESDSEALSLALSKQAQDLLASFSDSAE